METLLASLAVVLVAFCVWLTVRIVNRRERWAKWTAAAIVGLPVIYIASMGPACWISSRTDFGDEVVQRTYWPWIQGIFYQRPSQFDWFYQSMAWYSRLAAHEKWGWGTDGIDGQGQFVWGELYHPPPPALPDIP